jgi:hypothetical protein
MHATLNSVMCSTRDRVPPKSGKSLKFRVLEHQCHRRVGFEYCTSTLPVLYVDILCTIETVYSRVAMMLCN